MNDIDKDFDIILSRLFKKGFFKRLISPFTLSFDNDMDTYLKEELELELILILLEYKDKEKLIKMYAKNQLGFFCMRIIKNTVISTNSKWYKKFQLYDNNRVFIEDYDNKGSQI